MKRESLVSHLPVCDKEICSIQVKQTNKKLHIQMKYNFQNKCFSLGRATPHSAYKASVELPSCSAYMNNGNCLMIQNFSGQTELPNHGHSYANCP